jgi:hypothetical protein
MRRVIAVAAVLATMLAIPATGAADECPSIEGRAFLDFGPDLEGTAYVVYDGERLRVPFDHVGISGGNTVFFVFHFPDGDVDITETATITPVGDGGTVAFESDLVVTDGGSGSMEWSGVANVSGQIANIMELSGNICVGS